MSRRRGEFEHRTSIFEGAYRAWSHLGGVDPTSLSSTTAAELDPLSRPHVSDSRIKPGEENKSCVVQDSDGVKRMYPYEPLPRTGLSHPFVQAIISPWLGPDAEQDDIQLGLTTLRTWWQHRRKGESTSAKQALGTEKMRSVVEGYTRHFFNLAHCMVMNDGEQPPRSLAGKIKELEKNGEKLLGMRSKEEAAANKTIPPKREVEESDEAGGCCGGGGGGKAQNNVVSTDLELDGSAHISHGRKTVTKKPKTIMHSHTKVYGDPNITPVVFVSQTGDIQIAMSLTGITCDHCVKIIETVLKGVSGSQSPISGLLDAAADRELQAVIIKISKSSFAKRIAFEAKENLKLVGYDATAKEINVVDHASGMTADLNALSTAFDVVAATDARDVFDWNLPCSCPDNGIVRLECARHTQMNKRIFESFDQREKQVREFMAGCGKKYGMPCTCGAKCKCSSGKCGRESKSSSCSQTPAKRGLDGLDKASMNIEDDNTSISAGSPVQCISNSNPTSERMETSTANAVPNQTSSQTFQPGVPMSNNLVSPMVGQLNHNMSYVTQVPGMNAPVNSQNLFGQHGNPSQFQQVQQQQQQMMHQNNLLAMQQAAAMQNHNQANMFAMQQNANMNMLAMQQQQQHHHQHPQLHQQQQSMRQGNWDVQQNGTNRMPN